MKNILFGTILACAGLMPCVATAEDVDQAALVDNALLMSEMEVLNSTQDLKNSLAGLPRPERIAACVENHLPPKTGEAVRKLIREAATPDQLARGAALANSETSAKLRFYALENREALTAEAKKLGVPLDEYILEKGSAKVDFTAEESIVLQEFIAWYRELAPSLREKFKKLEGKLKDMGEKVAFDCMSSN